MEMKGCRSGEMSKDCRGNKMGKRVRKGEKRGGDDRIVRKE